MKGPLPHTLSIVIALDPAAPVREVLDLFARRARRHHDTRIAGLYVEDVDLLRLASLPCAAEVRLFGGGRQPLDAAALQRDLARNAERLRAVFATAFADSPVPVAFEVRRGPVIDELRRAGRHHDLLVVGRSLRSAGLRTWHGIAVSRVADDTPAVLFVHEPWATGRRVAVLADDPAAAERAWAQAARLVDIDDLERVDLLPAAAAGAHPTFVTPPALDAALHALVAVDARLVIVTAGWRRTSGTDLSRLVDSTAASVLALPPDAAHPGPDHGAATGTHPAHPGRRTRAGPDA